MPMPCASGQGIGAVMEFGRVSVGGGGLGWEEEGMEVTEADTEGDTESI
jgi:hypothetical protein